MMPKRIHLPELDCPPVRAAPQAAPSAAGLEGALPALIVFQCMWLPHFITEGQEHGLRPIQLLSRARSADDKEPVHSLALYTTGVPKAVTCASAFACLRKTGFAHALTCSSSSTTYVLPIAVSVLSLIMPFTDTALPTHLQEGFAIDQRVGNWAIVTRVSGVQGIIALKPNMPCWYLYAELRFAGMAELRQAAFYNSYVQA